MASINDIALITVIALVFLFILGNFIPTFGFLTPGVGVMIIAILLAVFVGFKIIQKDFAIGKGKDLFGLLIVAGVIIILFLLGLGVIGGDFFKASTVELKSLLPANIQSVLP